MDKLAVDELQRHPGFKDAIWDLPPAEKGKVDVAKGRGGPFKIAYEIHGNGAQRIVWIIGLGNFKNVWQRQVKKFGHDQGTKYSCLIFDNRGMGESDIPLLRYSTTEMARDTIDLLDGIGWRGERQLHVVGVSMGSMVAQELTFLQNLQQRLKLFLPRSLDATIASARASLFSPQFLSAPDAEGVFATNADRYAAEEVAKRLDHAGFTRMGFILQAVAAGGHRKTPEQVLELAEKVGRGRILVCHGGDDQMVAVALAEELVRLMNAGVGEGEERVRLMVLEGAGHVLAMEKQGEIGEAIGKLVERTSALSV
ncbi:Alpha/Beta hydrolase protein [Usnea florida]